MAGGGCVDDDEIEVALVLERLDPMPMDALLKAAVELENGLRGWAPELSITATLFRAASPDGEAIALPG